MENHSPPEIRDDLKIVLMKAIAFLLAMQLEIPGNLLIPEQIMVPHSTLFK